MGGSRRASWTSCKVIRDHDTNIVWYVLKLQKRLDLVGALAKKNLKVAQ